MTDKTVWIVDDDESIRWVVERALDRAGLKTRTFASGERLLDSLSPDDSPDLLITDLRMPGISGHELMQRLPAQVSGLPVIVITAHGDLDATLRAYQSGALEMLPKPFDVAELVEISKRLLADSAASPALPERGKPADTLLIGDAPKMQSLYRIIGRLSRAAMPVLITGESGTGKELIARTLHENSPRSAKPYVAINTAAIPDELLESELFGHERGAFTGAHAQRLGRFEQAEGGTLFLDEIGDMPLGMQTRLLRVLSEREFFRVGGHRPIRSDVRVIAATHQDLDALAKAGRFREDLYHRLNVVQLSAPPLRERTSDIPALAAHFLLEAAEEMQTDAKQFDKGALALLQQRPWPGNVRELRNFCRRMTALAPTQLISREDVLENTLGSSPSSDTDSALASWLDEIFEKESGGVAGLAIQEIEQLLIRRALAESQGHKQQAARRLGWGRNTLTRKMQEYGIDS
ncbi:MAG: nitrogen regulation protein NR(I) [Gammaproteobacteria bacterium]|nr:nitrogen regulation protein NR(I) [Gammaproteobacteria bacterium]